MNGFVRHKIAPWAAVVAALVTFLEMRAQDDASAQPPTATAPQEQQRVIVLHDGGVLAGEMRQVGDRYLLKRGGVEMQIRAANVLLVATSMDDAYEQRCKAMGQGDAPAHLRLAEWCLRHNLLDHAATELAAAGKTEPENGWLALLKRRLALASERSQNPPPSKAPSKPAPPVEVELVQAESSIGDLPEGAVELFTRRVQPVLVNSCTTSGCHEAGGQQKFQLDRALLHGLANRRTTMRNLAATLQLVNREHPQLSPLLTVPRQTHGGMERPVFGQRQEAALRHVVDWVAMVSKSSSRPLKGVAQPDDVQTAAAEEAAATPLASPIHRVPRTLNAGEADDGTKLNVPPDGLEPLSPQPIRYGAQLKRWTPRDAFDPEIFNRQNAPPLNNAPAADETTAADVD